jgi:hypothetical protein
MTPVSRAEPMVGVAPGGGRLAGPPLPGYDANGAARTFPISSAPRGPSGGPGRTPCVARELDWTHGIDIDTEEDWRLAEALMGRS